MSEHSENLKRLIKEAQVYIDKQKYLILLQKVYSYIAIYDKYNHSQLEMKLNHAHNEQDEHTMEYYKMVKFECEEMTNFIEKQFTKFNHDLKHISENDKTYAITNLCYCLTHISIVQKSMLHDHEYTTRISDQQPK